MELDIETIKRLVRADYLARKAERLSMLTMLSRKVCFDHLETHNCDHAACFELMDLHRKINLSLIELEKENA